MIKKLFSVILILTMLCGCAADTKNSDKPVNINPLGEAAAKDTVYAVLYFACPDGNHIAGETIQIKSPLNERVEVAIIENLIKGPSSSSELDPVINAETKILSIDVQNDIFIVAFSNQFLSSPDVKLAVKAITNTLIHYGGYKRVQVMVADTSGNAVRRLTLREYGENKDGFLESLGYDFELVLTPENAVLNIFTLLEARDYDALYKYILQSDSSPSQSEFSEIMDSANINVTDYAVLGYVDNDSYAIVCADFMKSIGSGTTYSESNMPISIRHIGNLWKIEWQEFRNVFLTTEK